MESCDPGLTWAKVPCIGLPGFCGCCSQDVWLSLCMEDAHAEMRKLEPQKRGTEGRDSCLDIACQLVRHSQMVRLQTEMLVDKGVGVGQYLLCQNSGPELWRTSPQAFVCCSFCSSR